MTTSYHSQYWAHRLTIAGENRSPDQLSRPLASARMDINPHQVAAALFACRSPLSKGVLLADEVGLGKTIEAGLVIAQRWAENRRHILLILPATLRMQWHQELAQKFSIPAMILESKTYREFAKEGKALPFLQTDKVVIVSYHFASARASEIKAIPWDLVVIDEAHRLRNVYKKPSAAKMAHALKDALVGRPKLLLTATPLQNSLDELFGLVSIIDPQVFGDLESFHAQFTGRRSTENRNQLLRDRISKICWRSLRRQVMARGKVQFTNRIPITQPFTPTPAEQTLYEEVSEYLRRPSLAALPTTTRALMTLVLRKLLASSPAAIASTLRKMANRLEETRQQAGAAVEELLTEEFTPLEAMKDEWEDEDESPQTINSTNIDEEIATLRRFATDAETIPRNEKGQALLTALQVAFKKIQELGALRKAVIFTESRKTQNYLIELLTANGYPGQIILINGTNDDPGSQTIYRQWLERHDGTDAITGSKTADIKAALVEAFRTTGTLLIATESAAEGVNLQFCSLVVNYDLPWNPQRVEQRIGRCHRYGQKFDVVVVNFINQRNEADKRVFELLDQKFQLFKGVFGASDEVLGAVESGLNLERSIARIYQDHCRTNAEITKAFDALQLQLETTIKADLLDTRRTLIDNFDHDVHQRLGFNPDEALATLNEHQKWLLSLTRTSLNGAVPFDPAKPRFEYAGKIYNLDWKAAEQAKEEFYHPAHKLAMQFIDRARSAQLPLANIVFDLTSSLVRVAALLPWKGRSGWLTCARLQVKSANLEEFLVMAAHDDEGNPWDEDTCHKAFTIPVRETVLTEIPQPPLRLKELVDKRVSEILGQVEKRNAEYYDEEDVKLTAWADDRKFKLEEDIRQLAAEIKATRKVAQAFLTLAEKVGVLEQVKQLETKRVLKRRELFQAEDEIDRQREVMIAEIRTKLQQHPTLHPSFTLRWSIV